MDTPAMLAIAAVPILHGLKDAYVEWRDKRRAARGWIPPAEPAPVPLRKGSEHDIVSWAISLLTKQKPILLLSAPPVVGIE